MPPAGTRAAYLAAEYSRLSLEAAGDGGTFLQRYHLRTVALDTDSVRPGTVTAGGDARTLAYGTDFFALPAGPGADVTVDRGRLALLGPLAGTLPPGDYRGVLAVVPIPGAFDDGWAPKVIAAREAARAAGAPAVLVVADSSFSTSAFERFAASWRTEDNTYVGSQGPDDVPVFVVTHRAFRSIADGSEVHFAAPLRVVRDARPANVVAVLRGSDPRLRDEFVVLSAHMDHLGVDMIGRNSPDSVVGSARATRPSGASRTRSRHAIRAGESPPSSSPASTRTITSRRTRCLAWISTRQRGSPA